jgi:hypothetical protein
MSPADERAHMPVVQAEESKRPRKVLQVGEQLVNTDAVSDSPSNIIQNRSSGPASLAIVQEEERVHGITDSPDVICYSLESGKNEDVGLLS